MFLKLISYQIHSKLMQTCTFFATYTSWLSRELERTDPGLLGIEKPQRMSEQQWTKFQMEKKHNDTAASNSAYISTEETRLEKMHEIIKKYEMNFGRHLQILLDALNHYAATETVVLLGLCARLSTANQGTHNIGLRSDDEGRQQE